RLPDTQEPDPSEAPFCQAVQFGIRNVIQRCLPAQLLGQLREPDAGIDLIERRVTWCGHPSFLSLAQRKEAHRDHRPMAAAPTIQTPPGGRLSRPRHERAPRTA